MGHWGSLDSLAKWELPSSETLFSKICCRVTEEDSRMKCRFSCLTFPWSTSRADVIFAVQKPIHWKCSHNDNYKMWSLWEADVIQKALSLEIKKAHRSLEFILSGMRCQERATLTLLLLFTRLPLHVIPIPWQASPWWHQKSNTSDHGLSVFQTEFNELLYK